MTYEQVRVLYEATGWKRVRMLWNVHVAFMVTVLQHRTHGGSFVSGCAFCDCRHAVYR